MKQKLRQTYNEYKVRPNLDTYYGLYDSIEEALKIIPPRMRSKGRTVGILEDGSVVEYWFESGIEDSDLIVKNEGGGTSFTGIETEDSDTVIFTGNGTVGNPLSAESVGGGTTGDYIPLSGTEVDKPVTGPIVMKYYQNATTDINSGSISVARFDKTLPRPVLLEGAAMLLNGALYLKSSTSTFYINSGISHSGGGAGMTSFPGIKSDTDFSDVTPEDDLIYTQRRYCNKQHSYSTTETLTGGTWIDGKPIYRKVIEGLLGTLGESSVEFIGADAIDVVISKFIYTRGNNGLSDIEFAEDGFTHLAVRYDNINQSFNIISKPDKAGNTYYLTVEYTKISDVAP